jgi:hypothetical protein
MVFMKYLERDLSNFKRLEFFLLSTFMQVDKRLLSMLGSVEMESIKRQEKVFGVDVIMMTLPLRKLCGKRYL